MADQILPGTMTGTTPTAPAPTVTAPINQPSFDIPQGLKVPDTNPNDLQGSIRSLSSVQNSPNMLMDFTKVMRLTSTQAYNDRQGKEMAIEGTAFDPSKVSGGTFATIIGNLEQNRGQDIGKVYAATLNTYSSAQEQITNRLQFLKQLEESRRQFEKELKIKKQELKLREKSDKASAALAKKQLDFEKSTWEKEFAFKQQQAKKSIESATYLSSLGVDLGEQRSAYEQYFGGEEATYSPIDLYTTGL